MPQDTNTTLGNDSTSAYLRIRNLWKAFGDFHALKDISLDIEQGEFVCFLGPSGCGKTTLLRAIAGLDLQTSGTVHQDGADISTIPPAGRDFGIVFQSYALFPNLTVERNIAFGLENSDMATAAIKARVAELLDLIGMPEQATKYPAQLSGGQQQRVALARAIAMSPGLLLLDEPLSALDAKVRVHLRHEVKKLQRKLGVTTIMVTHDQEEALAMADRIVVMNHGTVEQIGAPTEIYGEPTSLFVADFIGEMNQIKATVAADGGGLMIGSRRFSAMVPGIAAGTEVIAAIRPEDIIPHEADAGIADESGGTIEATIESMEFLGSFWRTSLRHPNLGNTRLVADFSINAARRLSVEVGAAIKVEIPSTRLKAYPTPVEPLG